MNLNINGNRPVVYSDRNKRQSSNIGYCTKSQIKTYNNEQVNFKGVKDGLLNLFIRPKTEEAVIKKLSSKKSGCYYKVKNRYKKISSEEFNKKKEFNYGDIIIKQPKQKRRIYPSEPLTYEIREGISPIWIIKGLKQKMGSITIIAESSQKTKNVQKLVLPKDDKKNSIALEIVEQFHNDILNEEKQRKSVSFPNIPDAMYNSTQKILSKMNCKDITLNREVVPTKRKSRFI